MSQPSGSRLLAVLVPAALALTTCLPAAAAAETVAAAQTSLSLKTKNGFTVSVGTFPDSVGISVSPTREKGSRSETSYVAKGRVGPQRLQASFGSFGSVSMRFRPSHSRSQIKPHRRCSGGGRFLTKPGVWTGRLQFTGEGGYVSVDARRAKGTVTTVAPRCRRASRRRLARAHGFRPPNRGRPEAEVPFLEANWREGPAAATLLAIERGRGAAYVAETERTEGRVAIFRAALATSQTRTFSIDDALTSARITPPPPFSGVGTYRAAPDGTKSWSGSLAVDFPGAPDVPLTGPPFTATVGTIPGAFVIFPSTASSRLGPADPPIPFLDGGP